MRRLVLDVFPDAAGLLRLEGKDFRYLVRVLRLKRGDSFRALLPDGREAAAELAEVGKSHLEAFVRPAEPAADGLPGRSADEARRKAAGGLPPIVLLQALPKGTKMDLIVRQAAEAGVARILPFVSERSVPRPDEGARAERKRERWERIIREARQQSGSDAATEILDPLSLEEALSAWKRFAAGRGESAAVFLHQDPLAQGSLHGYLSGDPQAVALAVGPEGGFSSAEADVLAAAGFRPALLGENVLRTETAAVFALAAVQVILLEKGSWHPKTPCFPTSNE